MQSAVSWGLVLPCLGNLRAGWDEVEGAGGVRAWVPAQVIAPGFRNGTDAKRGVSAQPACLYHVPSSRLQGQNSQI